MPGRGGLPVYGGRPGRPGGNATTRVPDTERRRGLSLRIVETRKARTGAGEARARTAESAETAERAVTAERAESAQTAESAESAQTAQTAETAETRTEDSAE